MLRARPVELLLVLVIALFVYLLSRSHTESLSPQSLANLQFASNPSYVSGLSQYPKYWPPFYPSVLWLSSKAGITPRGFNLTCVYLCLFLVGLLSKHLLTNIHWFYVVLAVALINANYVNSYQLVAEPLLVLLAFVVLSIIVVYGQPWTSPRVVLLAVLSAISCLTRFFALCWLLPLCLAYICLDDVKSPLRKRLVHATVYCSIVALLVLPWLMMIRHSTGSFSGMDRFAPRGVYYLNGQRLPIAHIFGMNARFLIKTVFIDFLSPFRYASHPAVRSSVFPSEITAGVIALLLASLGGATLVLFLHRQAGDAWSRMGRALVSQKMIPVHFTAAYLLWLMVLWSLGNNDPIYTRFAYPAYPLAVFSAFVAYSWIKSFTISPLCRLPFVLLFLLIGGINVLKAFNSWAKPV